jgi:hypothetical protein
VGEALRGERFRYTGNAFEQDVTADEEGDEELADDFVLPDDGFGDFGADVFDQALDGRSGALLDFFGHDFSL